MSRLPVARQAELAELMFSNLEQHKVQTGIVNSIERYGVPRIITRGDSLGFSAAKLPEVQTLFAIEGASGSDAGGTEPLAGVMLYARAGRKLVLLHIGVHPDYSSDGSASDGLLVLRLIEQLRAVARSVEGVDAVELMYGAKGTLTLRA